MGRYSKRESRKPKTAPDRGKRYRCCVCKKRAPRKTKEVPYYCDNCAKAHEAKDNPVEMTASTKDTGFSSRRWVRSPGSHSEKRG